MKVCKFGGTSMANSKTITQVADIVRADKQRRYVVVSAPGKRTSEDIKVTDALYTCHREKGEKGNCDASFAVIEKRFLDIEKELGVDVNMKAELAAIKKNIEAGASADYTASRGEYLSARVLAAVLGVEFVDTADPRIVRNPEIIECLSSKELRELAYMGAEVLHPESVFPVRTAGIPINIKNTFNPSAKGTMIVPDGSVPPANGRVITGIAGRKGFTIINIEKDMMNREIGFGRKALSILEYEGISFEHMPSGIDTLSLVIRDEYLGPHAQKVVSALRASLNADNIDIHSGLSLIATVGHNMASRHGTAATIFAALAASNINIRMIDQGSSEMNIIVGVDTFDYEKAICAIYHAFC